MSSPHSSTLTPVLVISNFFTAGQESEREALRRVAVHNMETLHILTHTSFMKRTMESQKHQGQQTNAIMDNVSKRAMESQEHQGQQTYEIMSHISTQFEMLRADLGQLTRPAPIVPVQSPGDQEAGASPISETDGERQA